MGQIDKQTVQRLARSAAESYISNKTGSLNEAVAETVRSEGLNKDQIERVVQAANQATWAMLTSSKDPASVRFDPADVNRVATMTIPESPKEETKEVSASFWNQKIEKDFASELGLQMPIEKDAALVIPTSDSRTWNDVERTIRKAQIKLSHEYDSACLEAEKLSWALIDTVHQGYVGDGLDSTSIRQVVTTALPEQAKSLLTELETAVFSTEKAAAFFSDLDREANLGRLTALPGYNPARQSVPKDHPIQKTAEALAASFLKKAELWAAMEYLDDLHKKATQLALQKAEVPAHVDY